MLHFNLNAMVLTVADKKLVFFVDRQRHRLIEIAQFLSQISESFSNSSVDIENGNRMANDVADVIRSNCVTFDAVAVVSKRSLAKNTDQISICKNIFEMSTIT